MLHPRFGTTCTATRRNMHPSYSSLAILFMLLVALLKVVKYINNAQNADVRPSVFVSATAIGYYGN